MMSWKGLLLVLMAWTPTAASAQSAQQRAEMYLPGMIVQPMSVRKYEETLRSFANCLIDEKAPEVKMLLALPKNSTQIHEVAAALAAERMECSPGVWWRADGNSIRYALVEMLYVRDFSALGSGTASIELGPDSGRLQGAKCVAKASIAASHALTMTPPASKEEKAAFIALEPYVRSCGGELLSGADEQRLMRYEITEALYRQRSALSATRSK